MATIRSTYEDNRLLLLNWAQQTAYMWPIGPITEATAQADDDYAYEGFFGKSKPSTWTNRSPLLR